MSPAKPAANAATCLLGLGSNLGDRLGFLRRALGLLREGGAEPVAVSSVYATDPVGPAGQPEFLNAAAACRTALEPEALLDLCQAVEAELGRVRAERWGPRTIDLDILFYGDRRMAGGRLELPHPRIRERNFVLLPLAELAPDRMLEGRTIAAWAAAAGSEGVRLPGVNCIPLLDRPIGGENSHLAT